MSLRTRVLGSLVNAYLGERVTSLRRLVHRRKRRGARQFDVFVQVDDPYSILLAQALLTLRHDVEGAGELRVTLVPPPPPDADPAPAARRSFALRDAEELVRHYALDFPANGEVPASVQVQRAQRVLLAVQGDWNKLELLSQLGRMLFVGDEEGIDKLGDRRGRATAGEAAAHLAANAEMRRKRGHYQGAMIRYEGDWYWGLDRLAELVDRLAAEGVVWPLEQLARRGDELRAAYADVLATEPLKRLEMYYSFRSPYSYLALGRVRALVERHQLELVIKPVLPMVMRGLKVPRAKRLYIVRDAKRTAARLGVPFGRICDPLGAGVERCLALVDWAVEQGQGLELLESTGRGIWSEALDPATDDDLRIMVERAGLDWTQAQPLLAGGSWRDMAEQARQQLTALGLWGVPCFKLGNFSTWGQDRIEMLEARLSLAAPG